MQKNITVFVADDHPLFRDGLIQILSKDISIEVIGFSGDGGESLEIIRQRKPLIAILDISMPNMSGLEIIKTLKAEKNPTLFIILTMYNDEEYLDEALDIGVNGYLLKSSTAVEVIECINSILNGGYYISKELRDYLIRGKKLKSSNPEIKDNLNRLTKTELHILKLLSENKTSTQIAEELFVSFRTVQNHRNNISMKLGLTGYNKLLFFVLEHKETIKSLC